MATGTFEHGSAYCTDDFAAAALWVPPDVHSDAEAMGALAMQAIPQRDQEKVFSFMGQMGEYHPTETHWYLPFIAVDPMHQGKGLGSALLIHALQICDRDQLPAYLEATSPDSRRLYERHGFEALGEIQVGRLTAAIPDAPKTALIRRSSRHRHTVTRSRCTTYSICSGSDLSRSRRNEGSSLTPSSFSTSCHSSRNLRSISVSTPQCGPSPRNRESFRQRHQEIQPDLVPLHPLVLEEVLDEPQQPLDRHVFLELLAHLPRDALPPRLAVLHPPARQHPERRRERVLL